MDADAGEVLDWLDAKRAEIMRVATAELGDQGKGSPRVREYWRRVMPALAESQISYACKNEEWCGVFALWCLHEAGVTAVPWHIRGLTLDPETGVKAQNSGFVYRLPKTAEPQPGDVFVGPPNLYHHGLVERRYTPEGGKPWLASVEGNTPTVRRRDRPAPGKGWNYYSIEPWLRAALEAEANAKT